MEIISLLILFLNLVFHFILVFYFEILIYFKGCPADWLKTLSDREVAKCNANEQKAKEPVPEGKLNPLRVLHVVDKVCLNSKNI